MSVFTIPIILPNVDSSDVSRIELELSMHLVRSFLMGGRTSKTILDIPVKNDNTRNTRNCTRRQEFTGISIATYNLIVRDMKLMRTMLPHYPRCVKIDFVGQSSKIVITQPGGLHRHLISALSYLRDSLVNQGFYAPGITKYHFLSTVHAHISLHNLSQQPSILSCDVGLILPGHAEPFMSVLITENEGREHALWKAKRMLLYTRRLRFVIIIHLVNELDHDGNNNNPNTNNNAPNCGIPLERFARATVTVLTRTLKPVHQEHPTPHHHRGRAVAILINNHQFWPLLPTAVFPLMVHRQGGHMVYIKFRKLHDAVNRYYSDSRKVNQMSRRLNRVVAEDEDANALSEELYVAKRMEMGL